MQEQDSIAMRALTILQPWAQLIAHGHKRIENRVWAPPEWIIGERIAIHAGRAWSKDGEFAPVSLEREQCASGAVVAVATVTGFVTSALEANRFSAGQGDWFIGPYGWTLENIVPLERPVPCRGNQKLWHLERRHARRIRGS